VTSTTVPEDNTSPDRGNSGARQPALPPHLPGPVRRFVGRNRELEMLQDALSRQGGPAVIYMTGAEGCGKSTLAAEAAHRLVADKRYHQVVYTDFAGGGALDAAAWELSAALDETISPHAENQLQLIREHLVSSPVLVIWNHLEALLPGGDAPVPDAFLRELLQAGGELFTDSLSKLVVITATNLPGFGMRDGILALPELPPLSDADARELLESVEPPTMSPEAVERILLLSRNYPIAIQALAALLHHFTLNDLETLYEQAAPGAAGKGVWTGQQAHDLALGAVWQVLAPAARTACHGLAIFSAGAMERLVSQMEGIDAESWRRFRLLALQSGLMALEQVAPLAIPYLRFHPVLQHFTQRYLTRDNRYHLHGWYCGSYLALQKWIKEQEQRTSRELTGLRWCELPNYRRAFSLLLSSQQLTLIQEYAQVLGYTLDKFGLQQEIEQINELMRALLQTALPKEGPLPRAGVAFMLDQVNKMLDTGKGQQALSILQPMCQRIERDDQLAYQGDDAETDRAGR